MRRDLQHEIAALGQEVRELARRQPGSLPDARRWMLVMAALAGDDRADKVDDGCELTAAQQVVEQIEEMTSPLLAEPVRAGLLRAAQCAATGDARSYRPALKALQSAIDELLALRGAQWRQQIDRLFEGVDLYRCALVWLSYPEEQRNRYIPPQNECTDPLVMAGMLLQCAAGEMQQRETEQSMDQIMGDQEQQR